MNNLENLKENIDTGEVDFDREKNEVIKRYPKLMNQINNSLRVPQVGDYHNEGLTMKSHLKLMLENLNLVRKNEFDWDSLKHEELSGFLKKFFAEQNNIDKARDYVFLHDIAKSISMQVKVVGQEEVVLDLDDKKMELVGGEYLLEGKKVEKVSYKEHGKAGGRVLMESGINQDDELVKIISRHDVGYQMREINIKSYRNNFGDLSVDGDGLAVAGLFLDLSASLNRKGTCDFGALKNFFESQKRWRKIEQFSDEVKDKKIKKQEIDRMINNNWDGNKEEFEKVVVIPEVEVPSKIMDFLTGDERVIARISDTYGQLVEKKNNEKAMDGMLRGKIGIADENIRKEIIKIIGDNKMGEKISIENRVDGG